MTPAALAPENQLQELRRYVEARGWTATEYVDRGVSGAKTIDAVYVPCDAAHSAAESGKGWL